jgi:uncharacterized RDD family membrane protein YckC
MQPNIASRRRRFFAWLIDISLLQMLLIPVIIYLFAIAESNEPVISVSLGIGSIAVLLTLLFLMRDSVKGISPGKYLLGLAVRNNGNYSVTPSLTKLFVRNIPLLLAPLEGLVMIFNPRKRRLGDLLTGTAVVRVAPTKTLYVWVAAVFLIGGLGIMPLFAAIFSIKNSAAYQTATQFLAYNEKVKGQIGEVRDFGALPGGAIRFENGYGHAVLNITVYGLKGSVNAQVLLMKQPGKMWEVRDLRLKD